MLTSGEVNAQPQRGRLCFKNSVRLKIRGGQFQPQSQRSNCVFGLHRYTQCLTQAALVSVHCLDCLGSGPDHLASCVHITLHLGYDNAATPPSEQEMRTLNILFGWNSENGKRSIGIRERHQSRVFPKLTYSFCLARISSFVNRWAKFIINKQSKEVV